MQITFDHTDLANPACRRILAALLDRDEPRQLALDLEPAAPTLTDPPVPAAPAPTEQPAPAAPADASAFPAFMQHVAKLQAAKLLPMVKLLEIIKRHGFATLIELSKRPEAIPAVMADLPGLPEVQS